MTRWTVNGDYTLATEDPTPLLVGIRREPDHNGVPGAGRAGRLPVDRHGDFSCPRPRKTNSFKGELGRANAGDIAFAITSFLVMSGYLRNIGENIRMAQRGLADVEDVARYATTAPQVLDGPARRASAASWARSSSTG